MPVQTRFRPEQHQRKEKEKKKKAIPTFVFGSPSRLPLGFQLDLGKK
jgi:hypothetical protein